MGPTGESAILQVHPTRRCNLRCLHCYSSSGPEVSEALEVGPVVGAVRDAARLGYDVLAVSGGEPFLYAELPELLAAARDAGMRTTVTTNGTALSAARLAAVHGLVDLVAVSLDGEKATHDRIRGRAGTYERTIAGMRQLARAGIPFGVITTLTAYNAAELAKVAEVAVDAGAGLLHVHPLEPEGAAREHLTGELPDGRELTYSAVEIIRVARRLGIPVQFDAVPRAQFVAAPAVFAADEGPPPEPLGRWLTPLVVEADGTVVPVCYGFDRAFALGSLRAAALSELARRWDARPFRELCRQTWQRLATEHRSPFVPWYEELVHASRSCRSTSMPSTSR